MHYHEIWHKKQEKKSHQLCQILIARAPCYHFLLRSTHKHTRTKFDNSSCLILKLYILMQVSSLQKFVHTAFIGQKPQPLHIIPFASRRTESEGNEDLHLMNNNNNISLPADEREWHLLLTAAAAAALHQLHRQSFACTSNQDHSLQAKFPT